MIQQEFSCLAYWQQRFQAQEPRMMFRATSVDGFERWQKGFAPKFVECLGRMPDKTGALDVEVLEELEHPLVGQKLPHIPLVDLWTRELRDLGEWAGRKYVVNVFASW